MTFSGGLLYYYYALRDRPTSATTVCDVRREKKQYAILEFQAARTAAIEKKVILGSQQKLLQYYVATTIGTKHSIATFF